MGTPEGKEKKHDTKEEDTKCHSEGGYLLEICKCEEIAYRGPH
jgi:hypothetical protein